MAAVALTAVLTIGLSVSLPEVSGQLGEGLDLDRGWGRPRVGKGGHRIGRSEYERAERSQAKELRCQGG